MFLDNFEPDRLGGEDEDGLFDVLRTGGLCVVKLHCIFVSRINFKAGVDVTAEL